MYAVAKADLHMCFSHVILKSRFSCDIAHITLPLSIRHPLLLSCFYCSILSLYSLILCLSSFLLSILKEGEPKRRRKRKKKVEIEVIEKVDGYSYASAIMEFLSKEEGIGEGEGNGRPF